MKYALLIYSTLEASEHRRGQASWPIEQSIAAILERPAVTGWTRLRHVETATTVRADGERTLIVDGPFVESKEFLGGVIEIDVGDLDGALAIARDLQETRSAGAIEIRPLVQ